MNNIPEGAKLPISELSTTDSSLPPPVVAKAPEVKSKTSTTNSVKQPVAKSAAAPKKAATYDEVKGLLAKNTCIACHNANTRQVGPAYSEVAKRNYSDEKIVDLIYNPQPQNWPDYATEMPPMPQVPKAEALKIASWINSLK